MQTRFEIIYEDTAVLVCRKPGGIAAQSGRLGEQDMESLLKNYRAEKNEPPYIGIVHRLDQPVEGLMVFAKTKEAAASLSRQISSRMIGKHYYAAVRILPAAGAYGGLPGKAGTLEDELLFDKKANRAAAVPEGSGGKKAVLNYRIVKKKEDLALLDITLHTGRRHQIRFQLAERGCPILGDRRYGPAQSGGEEYPLPALCAYRLEFAHPVSGKTMDFRIQPEFLTRILDWNNIK